MSLALAGKENNIGYRYPDIIFMILALLSGIKMSAPESVKWRIAIRVLLYRIVIQWPPAALAKRSSRVCEAASHP